MESILQKWIYGCHEALVQQIHPNQPVTGKKIKNEESNKLLGNAEIATQERYDAGKNVYVKVKG